MFRNSNKLVITGGQFTDSSNNHDAVSTILWPQVASGAIFDSAERYPAGRCYPQTRQRMINRIEDWIQRANSAHSILWMFGSAGAGKSALMQSICELLRDSDPGMQGGSFFFARGDTNRGNGSTLFVTLAYQLAILSPSMRAEINNALYRDPSLPTKSMEIQLRSLIIDPLLRCEDFSSTSCTPIIFIDGLGECDPDRAIYTQCQILTLISKSILDDRIPIRFMIASRPEYWIRESFETSPLSDITLFLSLREDIDANDDIRAYLTENFDKIRLAKGRIMQYVTLPWPPAHIVDQFVHDASGQYIYASTILKFVGDQSPFSDPQEQLRIITTPGPQQVLAFTNFDGLYAAILSTYPRWETMKRVLGVLLIDANLSSCQVLLDVPETEVTLVLDALSSLIDVVDVTTALSESEQLLSPIFGSQCPKQVISFCHQSFREFLLDEGRSGSYYVDTDLICAEVISAVLGLIHRNLKQDYEAVSHITCLSAYRIMMSSGIFVSTRYPSVLGNLGAVRVCNSILGDLAVYLHSNPRKRIDHLGCFIQDMRFLSDMLDVDAEEHETVHIDSPFYVIKELKKLASAAHEIGVRLLSLCDGLSITRTLFVVNFLKTISFQDLLLIPGNNLADIVSTMRIHRHLIDHCPSGGGHEMYLANIYPSFTIMDNDLFEWSDRISRGVFVYLPVNIGEGWLRHTEWMNQYISLVCDCLKSIMNNLDNEWEHSFADTSHSIHIKYLIFRAFFDNGDISDIHGAEYFENQYHLSLLEVLVDSKAWISVFPSRPRLWTNVESVIGPILGWFNRQLVHPETVKTMEKYDSSLPQQMTHAMNCIFQHCFVAIFKTPYFTQLLISTIYQEESSQEESRRTIKIKVLPSDLLEEDTGFVSPEDHTFLHIPTFLMKHDTPSTIPASSWYSDLATYLLNVTVKNLYRQTHPEFGGSQHNGPLWMDNMPYPCATPHVYLFAPFGPFFKYMVQCLPYAQATAQNLDALRAIKYLSPQLHLQKPPSGFYPPPGFCFETRQFLKRYSLSALSPEELSDFDIWLQGIKEFDEPIR